MIDLYILVVENSLNWKAYLPRILKRIGEDVHVEVTSKYEVALKKITNYTYHLIIMDLALEGDSSVPKPSDQLEGMKLVNELRNSNRNSHCGLIVLTANPTTERLREALRDYQADDFIEKDSFDRDQFIKSAQNAIRKTLVRKAENKAGRRYHFSIQLDHQRLIGCELNGPGRQSHYLSLTPPFFDIEDLSRRANNLNYLILEDKPHLWREEARSIGEAILRAFSGEQQILADMIAARALTEGSGSPWIAPWIELSSPSVGLGVPFELMKEGRESLCLHQIMTRRVVEYGPNVFRKPEPFHTFLSELLRRRESLRILIIGANSDGFIPAAETEAKELVKAVKADLNTLGLPAVVDSLIGKKANYVDIRDALEHGGYHIVHYAGHGRFDDTLAEISGMILRPSDGQEILTATDLNLLVCNTDLRLIYLSCCLGARNAYIKDRGDFSGMMDALVQGNIPYILGYRWTVADEPAMQLAITFYESLWSTLCPGEALLEARLKLATGERGLDDDTWASPVLVSQSSWK